MSQDETGKNDPLPRMSQSDAEEQARRYIDEVGDIIERHTGVRKADVRFRSCVGKNGEEATDARYAVSYADWFKFGVEHHNEAAEKIRAAFEKNGYTISTFRRFEKPRTSMIVEARDPKTGYFVNVESSDGSKGYPMLGMYVSSPCMIPPGEEQEQQQ
ncbi:hypothetical protein ACQUSR_19255 [Streptomyces sp. P1-3]|uniref:hypothetical protein n=1 Tax=Streptomyces sp. P1-3 TaxID=3421658 RepID=UPI003D36F802